MSKIFVEYKSNIQDKIDNEEINNWDDIEKYVNNIKCSDDVKKKLLSSFYDFTMIYERNKSIKSYFGRTGRPKGVKNGEKREYYKRVYSCPESIKDNETQVHFFKRIVNNINDEESLFLNMDLDEYIEGLE